MFAQLWLFTMSTRNPKWNFIADPIANDASQRTTTLTELKLSVMKLRPNLPVSFKWSTALFHYLYCLSSTSEFRGAIKWRVDRISRRQFTQIYCANAFWPLQDSWVVGVLRSNISFSCVIPIFFSLITDSSNTLNKFSVFPMGFLGFARNVVLISSLVRRKLSVTFVALSSTCKFTMAESDFFSL